MEAREVRPAQPDRGDDGQTVKDIMRARPKTLPATASVSDVRQLFADPHVVTALVVDEEGALVGVVERAGLADDGIPDAAPISRLLQTEVDAIDVRAPASDVWSHRDLVRTGRLVVLEPDGRTLAGLVCVSARPDGGTAFCR